MNGIALFQSVLFGNLKSVRALLYECQVDTAIFDSGRIVMMSVIIVDHILLLFALLITFTGAINEIYCRSNGLGGPTVSVFGVSDVNDWCIPDNNFSDTPFSTIPIFIFFAVLYAALYSLISLGPLIKAILMVLIKKRIDRRVLPIDLIEAGG